MSVFNYSHAAVSLDTLTIVTIVDAEQRACIHNWPSIDVLLCVVVTHAGAAQQCVRARSHTCLAIVSATFVRHFGAFNALSSNNATSSRPAAFFFSRFLCIRGGDEISNYLTFYAPPQKVSPLHIDFALTRLSTIIPRARYNSPISDTRKR